MSVEVTREALLYKLRTMDGNAVATIINMLSENTRVNPEIIGKHLMATQFHESTYYKRIEATLYLDNGVYVEIEARYNPETGKIEIIEARIRHIAECNCGE